MKKYFITCIVSFLLTIISFATSEVVNGIEWHYTVEGNEAIVGKDNGYSAIPHDTTGDISIPATLGGLPVVSIGRSAFNDCSNLTHIEIPSSVTSIDDYAFYDCSSLTSIEIPSSVTSMGYGVFGYCSSLTSLIFTGHAPTQVDNRVFYGASLDLVVYYMWGMTGWETPWHDVETKVFSTSESIEIDGVMWHYSVASSGAIIEHTEDGMPAIPQDTAGEIVIPEMLNGYPVVAIGDDAFRDCSRLTSIRIPSSVTSIGISAFRDCSHLTGFSIPASVTSIHGVAFMGCSLLTPLVFEGDAPTMIGDDFFNNIHDFVIYYYRGTKGWTNPWHGEKTKLNAIPGSVEINGITWHYSIASGEVIIEHTEDGMPAIPQNTVGEIVIPEMLGGYPVVAIGDDAFRDCSRITSVEIPSSVTSIGVSAFRDCSSLFGLSIPASVTLIDRVAFMGCWYLTAFICEGGALTLVGDDFFDDLADLTIYYRNDEKEWNDSWYWKKTQMLSRSPSIEIVNGIPWHYSITEDRVTIEHSDVDTSAIPYRVEGSIVIPTTLGGYPVAAVGDDAFLNCEGLTSVVIPSNLISIGNHAFNGCYYLADITFPLSLVSIGNAAFSGCSDLMNISIPASVTSIGDRAFYRCYELTSIDVAKDNQFYTSVDGVLFNKTLSHVVQYPTGKIGAFTVPSSVISIGSRAFSKNSHLRSLFFEGDAPTQVGDLVFEGALVDFVLYYPEGAINWTNPWHGVKAKMIPLSLTTEEVDGLTWHYSVKDGHATIESADDRWPAISPMTSGELTVPAVLGGYPVVAIGSDAFYGCTRVTSVLLSEGVESINSFAFLECSNLTSIKLPTSLITVRSYAFSMCSSLVSVAFSKGLTSIDDYAFNQCSGLMSVTLSEGLISIGSGTFSDCSSLTRIVIPSGVTSIGSSAFSDCSSLTSIAIPSSVTSIGSSAFSRCMSLTNIELPSGITSIDDEMFSRCSNLTRIVIPSGVASIGVGAFYHCSELMSVTLPEGLTSIGSGAFYECSSLTNVLIPMGVTSIGSSAFSYCSSLTSVLIPMGVTSISSSAFYYCSSLTNVLIPTSVTSIGSSAFYRCTRLTSVELPEGVTFIGSSAFSYCSSLTNIELPEGVTVIDWHAFSYCSNLTSIELPKSITSIGSSAFYRCTRLTSVELPVGMISIENNTFGGCSKLVSIELPESITSIGVGSFYSCSSLVNISIPTSVTSIGSSAFSYCSSLPNVSIPMGVTSIGEGMFLRCSSLRSISIPSSVTSIGREAFSGCTSLTSIELPEGITFIDWYAFSGCTSLTSLSIPASLTSIESYVFFNCSNLRTLIFEGCAPTQIGASLFYGSSPSLVIYYHADSTGWTDAWHGKRTQMLTKDEDLFLDWMDKWDVRIAQGSFESFKQKKTTKGDTFWQEFVMGTDPNTVNSIFSAMLSIVDGKPQIEWSPDLKEERIYKRYGKTSLVDKEWTLLNGSIAPNMKFFKVVVDLP